MERDRRVIICMPGVPPEMERMWLNEVQPELQKRSDGQVLVTRTVRELATGTDLVFTSRGTVGLRGVPGQWELFEASVG